MIGAEIVESGRMAIVRIDSSSSVAAVRER